MFDLIGESLNSKYLSLLVIACGGVKSIWCRNDFLIRKSFGSLNFAESDVSVVIKWNSRSIASQHATQQHGHTQTPHPHSTPPITRHCLLKTKPQARKNNQQNFQKDWFSDMINATRNWTDIQRDFQFRLSKDEKSGCSAGEHMRGLRNVGRSGDLMAQQTLLRNQFFRPLFFNLNNKDEGLFN